MEKRHHYCMIGTITYMVKLESWEKDSAVSSTLSGSSPSFSFNQNNTHYGAALLENGKLGSFSVGENALSPPNLSLALKQSIELLLMEMVTHSPASYPFLPPSQNEVANSQTWIQSVELN